MTEAPKVCEITHYRGLRPCANVALGTNQYGQRVCRTCFDQYMKGLGITVKWDHAKG